MKSILCKTQNITIEATLGGYTIIEGIVSMVLLSILLSIVVLISFNLYRSFPSETEMVMEQSLAAEMDSLVANKMEGSLSYPLKDCSFFYKVEPFQDLDKVYRATGVLSDTLGHELTDYRIFYIDDQPL